ncbi:hypothetical protein VP01_3436g1 [Puccinia sorghi]|uniref:Uncharacterized protein n=1 Tax=Puccinia sorghi TaxID=27349 RepID=A0A0L6UWB9_9BASI|nr:hypothetical protein VP01_3436g1 [Puccinia sorghi]
MSFAAHQESPFLSPFLFFSSPRSFKGFCIGYERVRYLIQKQENVLAKKDLNPFKSLSLWKQALEQLKWTTHEPIIHDSPYFIFTFQSPWQKQVLINHSHKMILSYSTQNSVTNFFMSDDKKSACQLPGNLLPLHPRLLAFCAGFAKVQVLFPKQ